jgi:hypothetical protein
VTKSSSLRWPLIKIITFSHVVDYITTGLIRGSENRAAKKNKGCEESELHTAQWTGKGQLRN